MEAKLVWVLVFILAQTVRADVSSRAEIEDCRILFSQMSPLPKQGIFNPILNALSKSRRNQLRRTIALNQLKGRAKKLAENLQADLKSGKLNQNDRQFHKRLEELLQAGLEASQASKSSLRALAALYLAYRDLDPGYWRTNRIQEFINQKDLSFREKPINWNSFVRVMRETYHHDRILRALPGISPHAEENSKNLASLAVRRARRLAQEDKVSGSNLRDDQLDTSDLKAVRVARLFHHARQIDPNIRLNETETRFADAYRNALVRRRRTQPQTEDLRSQDDVLRDEVTEMFTRDPSGEFFLNAFLSNPAKFRELISEIATENTDTGNDRLFIHLPGVFRITLEGSFTRSQAPGGTEVLQVTGVEGFVHESGFLNYRLQGRDKNNRRKWKKEETKKCSSCHSASSGQLMGFEWNGYDRAGHPLRIVE